MTEIGLPQKAIDALRDGSTVVIKSANLGPPGRNGRATLVPEGTEQYALLADVVEVREGGQ